MGRRTVQVAMPLLLTVLTLPGCGADRGDQPQVEQLSPAQAVAKQARDDTLRTRQQTTQIDR